MLIKIASNAYMKRILNGSLSKDSLNRLKPILRSEETMLKGFQTGTNNMIKRHNIKIKSPKNFPEKLINISMGGYSSSNGAITIRNNNFLERLLSPVSSAFKPKGIGSDAIAIRHELDEVVENKIRAKTGYSRPPALIVRDNKIIGNHNGLGVLFKERNNVRSLSAHGVNLTPIAKLRNITNEYSLLGNNSSISKIRKMKPNTNTEVETVFGAAKIPAFKVQSNVKNINNRNMILGIGGGLGSAGLIHYFKQKRKDKNTI